ncbi:FHA domain-containing protein [Bifidobacterium goeldii]|nr:FHA domain-containing protein [Bifidobacterium goeldii]
MNEPPQPPIVPAERHRLHDYGDDHSDCSAEIAQAVHDAVRAGIQPRDTAITDADNAAPASPSALAYELHNPSTGQSVTVDSSVLLGRHPAHRLPEGLIAVRLEDPTRTVSRNHAVIVLDDDGRVWIEDCGSLNGTHIIHHDQQITVDQGRPVQVEVPATIRIGNQFFDFDQCR